ncbi:chromate transporter [Pseudomonas oryzihabitans]|nr:chromate transporter [Pseudomonas psychrotolerans]KTT28455.1 chromate transporter [Pseudomonas psychrotolerans]KTT32421.1 chromate transporter [Pseudomonas psychrotolerans]KTT78012.1 chromate transporter [Pseudomonas psychrotolerans]
MHETVRGQDSPWQVFLIFLRLGCTSFGGPIAHLGYFRQAFVTRRRWLDESAYAELVALCQLLPGPTSSQVGMALGLGRAGGWGLLAAWLGFTLPSALLLILCALGLARYPQLADSAVIHGLKVFAVAVVAQAVWGMGRTLCPDVRRRLLALLVAGLALGLPGPAGQLLGLGLAALAGCLLLTPPATPPGLSLHPGLSRRRGGLALVCFVLPLLLLPLWHALTNAPGLALAAGVYRAGALVFGGGHVVLPLLQGVVAPGGLVSDAQVLAGYGLAQAVPGPLFTFAAYLGALVPGALPAWLNGLLWTLLIFLPGALVLLAALPFWQGLRQHHGWQRALSGLNAGVVGILLAALYDPVWTGAIQGLADVVLALIALALLLKTAWSPLAVALLVVLIRICLNF